MAVSFTLFPKPLSWKYIVGGALVTLSLYWLQRAGKRAAGVPPDAIDGAVHPDGPKSVSDEMTTTGGVGGGTAGSGKAAASAMAIKGDPDRP